MTRLRNAALFVALIAPMTLTPIALNAQGRSYHDAEHNDDHQWNNHEDKAYGMWMKENHRKNVKFEKLKTDDQRSYWAWRHEHSDAILKINIH